MIQTVGGLGLIAIGTLLIKGYKNVRWIPAPNERHIEETTIDYTKLALGIICIFGGIILVLRLI